ncbi:FGGY-family carbohydrate kinase [Pseudomonas sp. F1_0610]|uniref:FGGY-family carbohydrate kinase n=1 Tax=Pseudomonas sp. F1_0610 TaxID=3114284 RepID=UPI0039C3DEB1
MSTSDYLLALDNGTQSVRALVFDLQGNLIAKSQEIFEAPHSPKKGWAEQDANYFWIKLAYACQHLWQQGIDPQSIKAVCVTTQRGSLVHVDEKGNPLRPMILWMDQRQACVRKPLGSYWGVLFKSIGLSSLVNYFRAQSEVNWVAQNQPEIMRKTHKVLLLSGLINYRLTGKFVESSANCVAYLPFDYKKQRWAAKGSWKWHAIALRPEQLPDLLEVGTPLGEITEQASIQTGIPQGVPVIAGAADKACEVLGSGALEKNVACLSYGTTATINTTREDYLEITRLIPPYPAAVAGRYNTEVMIYRGFWMVSWFKQEFGLQELQLAERLGLAPEALFDDLVKQVPAGSEGLMLQPYWSPGLRVPGLEAKGAIIGFTDVHTRAHMYRAILEGIAYGLREGKERIEKRSGTPIKCLKVSGGGSQSNAAMQLTADIFGLPAERPHTFEASGLGAAIICAVALGYYPSYTAAVEAMVRVGDVFYPNPLAQTTYNQLYRRVYLKMYKRLRALYKQIEKLPK